MAVNGGLKLPIGYRFHPTDEELIVHYLRRKVLGLPLPASVIPEFDVFQTHPWSLPGNLKEKRYFFSQTKLNDIGTKYKRSSAVSGPPLFCWKPIGKGKQIIASNINQAVGIRKTLVYRQGKNPSKTRGQWVMHEYRLLGLATQVQMKVGDWVAYSVFQRKRRPPKPSNISKTQKVEIINPSFMDCMVEGSCPPPQPSSPCSSGVTEVYAKELDQEEISSFVTLFSYSCKRKKT